MHCSHKIWKCSKDLRLIGDAFCFDFTEKREWQQITKVHFLHGSKSCVFIAENLIGGFIWLGLSPFNSAAVNLKKCLNADDTATPDDTAAQDDFSEKP